MTAPSEIGPAIEGALTRVAVELVEIAKSLEREARPRSRAGKPMNAAPTETNPPAAERVR
jgi:hypothetical protein